MALAQTKEELVSRVAQLERDLIAARTALAESVEREVLATARFEQVEAKLEAAPSDAPAKIQLGDFVFGGAIRVNYILGDYPNSDTLGPSRGGDGGNFELDTVRFNIDYAHDSIVGKVEYRFFDGYNFLHTGWLGYDFDNESQLQVGVNRVPFGPGPYGASQSWFFDQHYYVGLADDMDLGLKYTMRLDDWTIDLAYYYSDEGNGRGDSRDSARYSYDVVDETGDGYEEQGQLNLRALYETEIGAVQADLGVSMQYGLLESNGDQDDGDHYAGSLHAALQWNHWRLTPQVTYYQYDIDEYEVQSGELTDDLIDMGAYDFAWPIASEAWLAAISLSYHYDTPSIEWLDYVMPYVEYSSIFKTESDFNDSELITIGAAWANGGWFIYTDLAFSNGNYFVGGDEFTNFGANPNDEWQTRFNINFGYYY